MKGMHCFPASVSSYHEQIFARDSTKSVWIHAELDFLPWFGKISSESIFFTTLSKFPRHLFLQFATQTEHSITDGG
jgi:hypothetical protein